MKPKNSKPYRVIGITGGIGSGKSAVRVILGELGYPTLDADSVSRELSSEGGLAAPQILERFKTLDRGKLRTLISGDAAAKADLEKILHPLIQEESTRQLELLVNQSQKNLVFYEASLLVETGRYKNLDGLLTLEAPEGVKVERIIARDHCTREAALALMARQTSEQVRRAASNWVIENEGDLAELKKKIKEWLISSALADTP